MGLGALKQEIFLLHSKIQLFESSIVRLEILENTTIGRKECEEMVSTIGKLTLYARVPQMVIIPNHATIYPEAREFSASAEGTRYSLSEAIISSNLAQKILVNFYLQFNKPIVPSRAFTEEDKAVEWLLTHSAGPA